MAYIMQKILKLVTTYGVNECDSLRIKCQNGYVNAKSALLRRKWFLGKSAKNFNYFNLKPTLLDTVAKVQILRKNIIFRRSHLNGQSASTQTKNTRHAFLHHRYNQTRMNEAHFTARILNNFLAFPILIYFHSLHSYI